MPRSLAPSSSEDDLVFEDEKIEEILKQSTPDPRQSTAVSEKSSSSSKKLEDIYFRGSRPRLDSTVDTSSAPISFANDFNDSNDSICPLGKLSDSICLNEAQFVGMKLQPFNDFSNEDNDIQAKSFRNHSIQTSNRQSTPVPDPTTQSGSRADPEMIFKGWGVTYEVRSSVDQRKPCCIFCCCICFHCFILG